MQTATAKVRGRGGADTLHGSCAGSEQTTCHARTRAGRKGAGGRVLRRHHSTPRPPTHLAPRRGGAAKGTLGDMRMGPERGPAPWARRVW